MRLETKTGRAVRCTPDHPWIVGDGKGGEARVLAAAEIGTEHWLPVPLGWGAGADATGSASLLTAVESAELSPEQLIVRPAPDRLAALVGAPIEDRRRVFSPPERAAARTGEAKRTRTVRLDEAQRASLPMAGTRIGTAFNGAYPSVSISIDEAFWRVVGLYLAEGHTSIEPGGSWRIVWSFHPTREEHLVDEVAAFWLRHGVEAAVRTTATARSVTVRSRIAAAWWTRVLGLGRTSYGQRIPDLAWDRPAGDRWALLSGLWEGDGSWSLVNGGPSVILEFGTVSDELADGAMRMLAGLGIVASKRTGRTARSTKDTHWLRISGAGQVQRALHLVPERDRPGVCASLERQRKRIAPTGHRRWNDGCAWVRVTAAGREDFAGDVYSLEVPGAHTFVTSDGLLTHNCFPKDVSALKQLAGNSGYHFQLLNAVIEVNELQKRRVVGKLVDILGTLRGKTVALLGLAFKPNTDDVREAPAFVLAGRLLADLDLDARERRLLGPHAVLLHVVADDVRREQRPVLRPRLDALADYGRLHGSWLHADDAIPLVEVLEVLAEIARLEPELQRVCLERLCLAVHGDATLTADRGLDREHRVVLRVAHLTDRKGEPGVDREAIHEWTELRDQLVDFETGQLVRREHGRRCWGTPRRRVRPPPPPGRRPRPPRR